MQFAPTWRQVRDGAYKAEWDDAYRSWRGKWSPEMRTRKKERSKLIAPSTSLAVDLAVAEIVEAIFGRDNWFDLPDDVDDDQRADMEAVRLRLRDDLYKDGIIATMVEVLQNAALYGTGAIKIVVETVMEATPEVQQQTLPDGRTVRKIVKTEKEIVKVFPVSVEPGQLIPDPAAARVPDMLGAIHEFRMPLHKIWERQQRKFYNPMADIGRGFGDPNSDHSSIDRKEEDDENGHTMYANVLEYHGLVPKKLLMMANSRTDDSVAPLLAGSETEMVEAVVTIANESEFLKARLNPSVMDDRGIIAFQFETVPNRFWGRGVYEKGKHPQKAIEAEMRARMDGLGWINNPMLGVDLTAMPSRFNQDVWPGKIWGTTGPPSDTLFPMKFGEIDPSTFQHIQDLERMHQQATGAMDSPARLTPGVRDQSSTASAVNASGMIKRAKRTMYNVESFLQNMLRGILYRKMQFDSERYPLDIDFQVKGAMGMMAREVEQGLMVNLLQFTETGTPEQLAILQGIIESSSAPNRTAINEMLKKKLEPPSQEEQARQAALKKLEVEMPMAELQKTRAQTALFLAQGDKNKAEALLKTIEAEFKEDSAQFEAIRLLIDQSEVDNQSRQMDISEKGLALKERQVVVQETKAKSGKD
jgi:hypothetical protein